MSSVSAPSSLSGKITFTLQSAGSAGSFRSAFAWAAARYKERAGDAIADRQIEKLRKAAVATLFATASKKPTEEPPYKRTIVVFFILLLMLVVGLVGVKLMHDARTEPPPATKPARP